MASVQGTYLLRAVLSSAFITLLVWLTRIPILSAELTRTCEPIRIEMCKGLGYNVTGMPNLVGHEIQQEAQLQFQTFTPLIQYGCSSQLKFFLCSAYVPYCNPKISQTIGPCRPLCENVRSRCQPILQEFGFPWPLALNCSKFPLENNHRHMCMEGPEPEKHELSQPARSPTGRGHSKGKKPKTQPNKINRINTHDNGLPDPIIGPTSTNQPNSVKNIRNQHYGQCNRFKSPDQYYYINRTERCAHSCKANLLFSQYNKNFADIWICIWSAVCFGSTLFTLMTFCVDSSKFRYPERAIIFLSANYNIYSIAYFIRLIAGRNSASCHIDSQHNESILIQEGLDNVYCTIIFVLLYFFGMASAVWWVILTITWFLTSGLQWSAETIQRKCTYFHVAAWGLPSLKTIAILVMRVVDADELTGTCYVGNQSKATLLGFVIIPSFIYLVTGIIFIIIGLIAMFKARRDKSCHTCSSLRIRHGSHHSSSSHNSHPHLLSQHSSSCNTKVMDKLELLKARIGIFALFYTVPATCVLAANVYEYISRDDWYLNGNFERPNVEIFTLKIFMSLVVGIKTGLWIWSSKTPITMWRKVGKRLKKQPLPAYLTANNPPLQKQKLIDQIKWQRNGGGGGGETSV